MSTHTNTMAATAADAVTAPLDLLLTDAAAGWRRFLTRREHTSMTADPRPPGATAPPWRVSGGERLRMLSVRGRILRAAVREGDPDVPALLLCNGVGGSQAPVVPYHLWNLAPLLSGLLDQLGYQRADVLGISWGGGLAQQFG